MSDYSTIWFVCYPRGDQSKLAVACVSQGCSWEKDDYSLASSKEFRSEDEAEEHARFLARKHNLKLKGVSNLLD